MPKSQKSEPISLAVIGGSGVYSIEELKKVREVSVKTPFGAPSDKVITGVLEGVPIAFLPRHGRGHRVMPSAINFRANIDVLKRAGVTDVISLSAVGSLREDLAPGTFVLVDQFIDRRAYAPPLFSRRDWWRTWGSPRPTAVNSPAAFMRRRTASVSRRIRAGLTSAWKGPNSRPRRSRTFTVPWASLSSG